MGKVYLKSTVDKAVARKQEIQKLADYYAPYGINVIPMQDFLTDNRIVVYKNSEQHVAGEICNYAEVTSIADAKQKAFDLLDT